MSLERRLREGVGRLTDDVDPDVERRLHTSLRSGRRRILVRRAGAAVGALAVVAAFAITVPQVLDAFTEGGRPAGQPSPSATVTTQSVAGTYTVTVDPGPAVVDALGLDGEWTIELGADGTMSIAPPPGAAASAEGYTFAIGDGRFETDAFVNDLCNEAQGAGRPIGIYRIEVVGGDLVLDALDDACVARVAILDDTILRSAE